MSKVLKRKFGVKQIIGESRELLCKECGRRAGEHYGSKCPVVDVETSVPIKQVDRRLIMSRQGRRKNEKNNR